MPEFYQVELNQATDAEAAIARFLALDADPDPEEADRTAAQSEAIIRLAMFIAEFPHEGIVTLFHVAGIREAKTIANAFGVTERTVRRWQVAADKLLNSKPAAGLHPPRTGSFRQGPATQVRARAPLLSRASESEKTHQPRAKTAAES